MSSVLPFLLLFPLFMLAVMVHEVCHGLVALRLGDSTARDAGRLTLNPLRHIDPVGTVVLPLFLIFVQSPFVFGWAKPVPVNAFNLRHPKRDMLWVGAAGPASNFLMAGVGAALLPALSAVLPEVGIAMLRYFVLVNLVLGTFNLLPVPPLDGSRVLTGLLPASMARAVLAAEQWGFLVLVALMYFGVLQWLVWPVVRALAGWLGL
ncbi:MAG: site-2 protease family protein [Candidatus Omnitrophica bacterium]|nr:site-2 protease family protein [Candidatus Omnitrophota bacterium]